MKNFILLIVFSTLILLETKGQDGFFDNLIWQTSIKYNKAKEVVCAEELSNGNFFVVSKTNKGFTLISIIDRKGNTSKRTLLDSGTSNEIKSITVSSGYVLLVGSKYKGTVNTNRKQGWIVKMSLEGEVFWQKDIDSETEKELIYIREISSDEFLVFSHEKSSYKKKNFTSFALDKE